jgi:hypothetical protein
VVCGRMTKLGVVNRRLPGPPLAQVTAAVFCGVLLSGCGRAASGEPKAADAEVERMAFVAQPCPALEMGDAALKPSNVRVFIEVAEITAGALPTPIGRWLDAHPVKVRSTANLVAFDGVPTSMPWGACVDAVCSATKWSLTLTSRLPGRASEPWPLALRIAEVASASPADAGAEGPKVLLETTLDVLNQQPSILPPAPEVTAGAIVVTPYLLQKHDDLHRVLECKVEQAEREQQLPQSSPTD